MKTDAEDKMYGVALMTPHRHVQLQVNLFNSNTVAATQIIRDTDYIENQLKREIDGITLNEQLQFKKEFYLCLFELDASWVTLSIWELQKTFNQCVIHFVYARCPM